MKNLICALLSVLLLSGCYYSVEQTARAIGGDYAQEERTRAVDTFMVAFKAGDSSRMSRLMVEPKRTWYYYKSDGITPYYLARRALEVEQFVKKGPVTRMGGDLGTWSQLYILKFNNKKKEQLWIHTRKFQGKWQVYGAIWEPYYNKLTDRSAEALMPPKFRDQ